MFNARHLFNVLVIVILFGCAAISIADNQNGQQGQNGQNNNQQNGQQGQNGPNNNQQNGNNNEQNGQNGQQGQHGRNDRNPNGPQLSVQDQIRFLDHEIDDLQDVRQELQTKLTEARQRIGNLSQEADATGDNLQEAERRAAERKQDAQAVQAKADQAAHDALALRQRLRDNIDEHEDIQQSAEQVRNEESKLNAIAKPLMAKLESTKAFERATDRLAMAEFRLQETQEQQKAGRASPRALVQAINDVNRLKRTVTDMKESEFNKSEDYRNQKEAVADTRADHLRRRRQRAAEVASNPELKAAYRALAEQRQQEQETRKSVVTAFKAKRKAASVAETMKTKVAALSGNVEQIERVSRELDTLIADRKSRRQQLAGANANR